MENTKKQNSKFNIKELLISFLTAILFSVFLPIFVYTNNIEEASFTEVLPLILIFAGIGAGICGIFFLCFRKNIFLTTVSSVLLILVLSNYALIEKLMRIPLPKIETSSIIILTLCVLLILILIINQYTADIVKESAPKILLLVISVLVALNIVMALPAGIHKLTVQQNAPDEPVQPPEVSDEKLPNVYYLLFDEYSNTEVMKKYYDYDNSEFDRYLEEKGFAVSQDTMNGNTETIVIATNYVNYDYIVNDDTSFEEKALLRENNNLKKLFASKGYALVGVGDSGFFGVPSVTQSDNTESRTMGGDTLKSVILLNTVYKVYYQADGMENVNNIRNAFSYFDAENLNQTADGGNFTMMYICSPHPPFLFNRNGGVNELTNYGDWNNESYLDQYIYITKEIRLMIDNILANDEDCVIILQSDHAARNTEGIAQEDKMKPFNAVYYRGEDISEIKGQSGVNTIRLVLNRLFDMKLEVLEVNE